MSARTSFWQAAGVGLVAIVVTGVSTGSTVIVVEADSETIRVPVQVDG